MEWNKKCIENKFSYNGGVRGDKNNPQGFSAVQRRTL